jgi:hypothetical protein
VSSAIPLWINAWSIPEDVVLTTSATSFATNDPLTLQLTVPTSTPQGQAIIVLDVEDASYETYTFIAVDH